MDKTKKNQSTKTWDVVPELGQYEVRYKEYTLKTSNIIAKLSRDQRPFLAYGEGPMIDCEFDDDYSTPDYLSYKLPQDCTETIDRSMVFDAKEAGQMVLMRYISGFIKVFG